MDDSTRTMADLGQAFTVEECRALALKAGYTILSVQFGHECFGSSNFAAATRLGLSVGCNTGCDGAAYQECGGAWAHSMYLAAAGEARMRGDCVGCLRP